MAFKAHQIIANHPTHLFVGPTLQTSTRVMSLLQELLCPHHGCSYCALCVGVYEKSSPYFLWLEPENNYTRDIIQPIFDLIALKRGEEEPFFIIMAYAERLQHATANALLKSLEEPSAGYYFFLMTAHERLILPTIRSRSLVHSVAGVEKNSSEDHQIFAHFIGARTLDPVNFLKMLDILTMSEQESTELLHMIINNITTMSKKNLISPPSFFQKDLITIANLYITAAKMPPQPGSSKIFWKNLYMKTISYHKTIF